MGNGPDLVTRIVCSAVLSIVVVAGGSASPAAAQDTTTIDVYLNAPASIAPTVTAQLVLDGTDVTATYCTSGTDDGDPRRVLECTGLPDGTYDIGITGQPADALVDIQCTDIVAARSDRPTIGGGFTNWFCSAYVAPPSILVGLDYIAEPGDLASIPGIEVRNGDGEIVSDTCEPAPQGDSTQQWCLGLPVGTYTAGLTNVPDGYRSSIGCYPLVTTSNTAWGIDRIELSVDDWLWSCGSVVVVPPLIVSVFADLYSSDDSWLVDVVPTLLDQDGVDVSQRCSQLSLFDDDLQDYGFVEFECLGLEDGTYTATVTGVPERLIIDNRCQAVPIPGPDAEPGVVCTIGVRAEQSPVTTGPTTTVVLDGDGAGGVPGGLPSSTLPITGAAGGAELGVLAALVVVAGTLLCRLARRPAPSGH